MTTAPTMFKQPAEARTVTFNFGTKLNTGDTVTAIVGLEVAAGITAAAGVIVGNKVTSLISGGTVSLTPYRISCRVTTTQGETLELDVNVRVADGVN